MTSLNHADVSRSCKGTTAVAAENGSLFFCLSLFPRLPAVALLFWNLQCEELVIYNCAFAVSSTGNRCLLEKYAGEDGTIDLKCQTSKIMADTDTKPWIESEECINSCGLHKITVGLSTDALDDKKTLKKICSSFCQRSCTNIFHLFTNLAAEEGTDLQRLCKSKSWFTRKVVAEVPAATPHSPIENSLPPDTEK
ncbi:uncharacterized protein LOC131857331 [Cryptomeria japonica]|uniref:uncharacterized protein LOC131857331 n=1 Tax=Cryptomeria japonica TaxID=3369 RepID=UPI0027DA1F4D|nr:uncharacterized protein LOC131857331 [Cryptomeria japonica]